MKNVINKIFSGELDPEVHDDFVKFSRGKFENRYLLEGKKQADKWAVKSSAEFANYFVRKCLEKISEDIQMKGVIVTTNKKLREEFDFEIAGEKGYMGIKQFLIDGLVNSGKIINLMNKYPKVFFALSFKTGDYELKIKAKAPKSGKPGAKGEDGPKADFCSLKTTDSSIIKDLFFDFPNFKEIKINHTIEVKDIEIPGGNMKPEEIREKSIRRGRVIRKINVDGEKKVEEKGFVA